MTNPSYPRSSKMIDVLAYLLLFRRGHTAFRVSPSGDLEPQTTVVTEKQRPGESFDAMVERLRTAGAWQPGDTVEVLNNDGRLDTIRITRALGA